MLIGFSVSNVFLRDKLGKSALGKLVISEMAIPYPVIISVCLLYIFFFKQKMC